MRSWGLVFLVSVLGCSGVDGLGVDGGAGAGGSLAPRATDGSREVPAELSNELPADDPSPVVDTSMCPLGSNIILGTEGEDDLAGTNGDDCILGLGGNDRIHGGNGKDVLVGGSGNDELYGDNGTDRLIGGPGDDLLEGGNGVDVLEGGPGNDILMGENGPDVCDGGEGNDIIHGGRGKTQITCGDGYDVLLGEGGGSDCEEIRPPVASCSHTQPCADPGQICVEDLGTCVYCISDASCDDGDACTDDACQPTVGCVHTTAVCDDGNACTTNGCAPEHGCVFVHHYGDGCPETPPPDDVTITDFSLPVSELHHGQSVTIVATLDAGADHPEYMIDFQLFPAMAPGDSTVGLGAELGSFTVPMVAAGAAQYAIELKIPGDVPAGRYYLLAHEYPEGEFVRAPSAAEPYEVIVDPELPVLDVARLGPSQQALLVGPGDTVDPKHPDAYRDTAFAGSLQLTARNATAAGVPVEAFVHWPDASNPVPLEIWDAKQGKYVRTLIVQSLAANEPVSIPLELALSETEAAPIRAALTGQMPFVTTVSIAVNGDKTVTEAECPPDGACRHSAQAAASLYVPPPEDEGTAALSSKAARFTTAATAAATTTADGATVPTLLKYDKSFKKYSENDYIGAGIAGGAGAQLTRLGFQAHVEGSVPLKIWDWKFDLVETHGLADASLKSNALLDFGVTVVNPVDHDKRITVFSKTIDEVSYRYPAPGQDSPLFPKYAVEQSYGFTVWVYCVPVAIEVGGRGSFEVAGYIEASSSLAAENAAMIEATAGPKAAIEGFGQVGVGVKYGGFELGVGIEVALVLVAADITNTSSGAVDIVLSTEGIPTALQGDMHHSMTVTLHFLDGRISLEVNYPQIEWCWDWYTVVPYPCGFDTSQYRTVLFSWSGLQLGPYTIYRKDMNLFDIPLPTCPTCDGHCGDFDNGCGEILHCGGCTAPQTCGGSGIPNVCGGGCAPADCTGLCGNVPDPCGNDYPCGGCADGLVCGEDHVCAVPVCDPADCVDKCGALPNGCDCGPCGGPYEVCGGGGTPNECGCTPDYSCAGKCGTVEIGCGLGQQDCGPCVDVGVIQNGPCPGEAIEIRMDDEDSDNANRHSGWIGSITSTSNTIFRFCRVNGSQLAPMTDSFDSRYYYAVLKLDNACPRDSVEFGRYFDNEDDDTSNWHTGDIAPNWQAGNTQLYFCLFTSGMEAMSAFPDFGASYGVFAAGDFLPAIETGSLHTDDEDHDNRNNFSGDQGVLMDANQIISGGANTDLRTARVK